MRSSLYKFILAAAFMVTTCVYWPGLSGTFLFDDYPNIVDNHGVQPDEMSVPSLVRAALSSPSSEFKRPLASLSFAANYMATGLNPYWMKLTNLVIHLLNGLLMFFLSRALLQSAKAVSAAKAPFIAAGTASATTGNPLRTEGIATEVDSTTMHASIVAALIATGWMLLPINLTAVLYVVQRMESLANLFVLLGLIGYVIGRGRMLGLAFATNPVRRTAVGNLRGKWNRLSYSSGGFILCLISITVPTLVGLLAKETAAMLPLYALLIEWALFRFRSAGSVALYEETKSAGSEITQQHASSERLPRDLAALSLAPAASAPAPLFGLQHKHLDHQPKEANRDWRVSGLFLLVLALPMALGLTWLLPGLLKPQAWAIRDFTLGTRLLSEARIIVDYIEWTLLPTPGALSFYHDNFLISTGLLTPWTTVASIIALAVLIAFVLWLRPRLPLAALGIALFLGCQLLTGTIIPLELIYEHRNYFASFGLLLAVVPLLAALPRPVEAASVAAPTLPEVPPIALENASFIKGRHNDLASKDDALPMAIPRYTLLAGLMLSWAAMTGLSAYAWGNPLRLSENLAARAPQSPRAQYELGRTYIIYSQYIPTSPFVKLAYASLERAAALPESSILPEQALIFMNARMHLPLKDGWWDSLIAKLNAHKPTVQDESSLAALTQCVREHHCDLPQDRMMAAFMAALAHPHPNARLLANYGDYAWNVLNDKELGQRMTEEAVQAEPSEPIYHITLIRMLVVQGRRTEALAVLKQLELLNIGGRLDDSVAELRALPGLQ
jgi:hypothetical protein